MNLASSDCVIKGGVKYYANGSYMDIYEEQISRPGDFLVTQWPLSLEKQFTTVLWMC